jgi:hypothetical protein
MEFVNISRYISYFPTPQKWHILTQKDKISLSKKVSYVDLPIDYINQE